MKKRLIAIGCVFAFSVLFVSWLYVTGDEIVFLKNINESYTANITIYETNISYGIDKDIENSVEEIVLDGERTVELASILRENIKCRRRLEKGIITIPEVSSQKDIRIVFSNKETGESILSFELVKNEGVYIENVSGEYLKNLNKDFENVILTFISVQ